MYSVYMFSFRSSISVALAKSLPDNLGAISLEHLKIKHHARTDEGGGESQCRMCLAEEVVVDFFAGGV